MSLKPACWTRARARTCTRTRTRTCTFTHTHTHTHTHLLAPSLLPSLSVSYFPFKLTLLPGKKRLQEMLIGTSHASEGANVKEWLASSAGNKESENQYVKDDAMATDFHSTNLQLRSSLRVKSGSAISSPAARQLAPRARPRASSPN